MSSLLLHVILFIASKWCFRPLNGLSSSSLPPVTITYPPPPSFSVSPSRPLYETGDTITMTCSPPNNDRVHYIRYFKDNNEIPQEETSTGKEQHTVVLKTKKDEGSYSCGYVEMINETQSLSYGSRMIDIRISDSTLSWIYYLTGCSIILITFMIAFLFFKHKRKRNNLKEVPESRGRASQQCVQEEHGLYSEIDSPSVAHKDIEEQHLYSEITICPRQEDEQHPPLQHSANHFVNGYSSVYCAAKAIDLLPVVYHTVLTQTTTEGN